MQLRVARHTNRLAEIVRSSSSTSAAWAQSARHASASALNQSSPQTRTGRHTASHSSTPTGFASCSFPTRG